MGIFTPTEASAVGAAGTFIILVLRRGFDRVATKNSVLESVRTTAMIFLIVIGSMIFAHFLALSGLSQWLVDRIASAGLNPYISLTAAIVLFFVVGCIMPALPMILLFVPLFYPIFVSQLGFDGIWFGVIVVVMTEIALITPPIGLNLFAFKGMVKGDISTTEMWQGVIMFVLADVFRVVILVAFPIIALWLPNTMFKI